MNSRVRTGITIAIIGFFLIALGFYVAFRFLNIDLFGSTAAPPPTPVPATTVTVALAVNDVTAGKVLTAQDLKLAEVPVEFAPRDTIDNLDNAVGRISKVDLFEGEMVLGHNLANPTGEVYDIAYVLDDTHVLMAMPATDLMSREAIIKRGDIVDILVSIPEILNPATQASDTTTQAPADQTPQQVTFTAFQKLDITAMVVDIIQNDNTNTTNAQTPATSAGPTRDQVAVQAYLLAMDPQNALVLKYLKDAGANFDYVLRAPTSSGQFDLTPVTSQFIKELYGLQLLP